MKAFIRACLSCILWDAITLKKQIIDLFSILFMKVLEFFFLYFEPNKNQEKCFLIFLKQKMIYC